MEDSLLSLVLNLSLVAFLVFLNGFFVAAEFAIVKVRETQLEPLVIEGHRRAGIAKRIVRNLDAALSATQLGITLASLGLGWVGEPIFAKLLEPLMVGMQIESEEARHRIAFVVGFSIITFLHIVLGELAPKSLAIRKPLDVTLWIGQPLEWFYKISFPFIWALNHTANWILRRVGIEPATEAELVHSEEELRLLFTTAQKHSGGTSLGRDVVLNALDLSRRYVREVMRPRREIVTLDTEATMAQCLDVAEKTRYSRFPLATDGDVDKAIGVVHFKDLYAQRLKARNGTDLKAVARKIIYVPPTCRLERLLELFLDRKLHLALVIDEYGGTLGLITLENILEEVVGQIQDEFDQEKPLLEKIGEHCWEVDGAMPLHELSELVGEDLAEENITTTSGFVTHRLSGFPETGHTLKLGNFELRVKELEGPTVKRLILTQLPPTDPPA